MSGRWIKPTGSTSDDVESWDPQRESAYFYFHYLNEGKDPVRTFHTDGSVSLTARDERPLRFVQRRALTVRQETATRFTRHV